MYKRLFNQLNKILLVKFAGTFGSEMLQFAISLYRNVLVPLLVWEFR